MTTFANRLAARTCAMLAAFSTIAHSQVTPSPTRGELLYNTHCVTCHTTQVHWREEKKAYDWDSLKFQVRRWQANAGLVWNAADITEVSRYLNNTIYRHPSLESQTRQAGQVWVSEVHVIEGRKQ